MIENRNIKRRIDVKENLSKFGIIYMIVLLSIVLTLLSKNFLTFPNALNVLRQASTVIILALGQAFVIISGGIDLSVGAVAALSGMFVSGSMVNMGLSPIIAIIIGISVGAFFGLINGTVISYYKISPLIVTLASLNGARGFALLFNNGREITGMPIAFEFIGRGYIGPIPVPSIIMIALIIGFFITATKTTFGRYIYAIGGNEEVARLAGIRITKIKVFIYIICGACAGLVGTILTARLGMGDPTLGNGLELDSIAAVVLGGVNLYGGEGRILGVVLGAILFSVLSNGLNLVGLSSFWQLVVKAFVLLGAAMVYSRKNN